MKNTLELLRLLTEKLPPAAGRSHAVVYNTEAQALVVVASIGENWQSFGITEDDFATPPAELVWDILQTLAAFNDARSKSPTTQEEVEAVLHKILDSNPSTAEGQARLLSAVNIALVGYRARGILPSPDLRKKIRRAFAEAEKNGVVPTSSIAFLGLD